MLVGTHQDDEICKEESYKENLTASIVSKYAAKYPNICSLRLVGGDGSNIEVVKSELERVLSEYMQLTLLDRKLPKKFFELERLIRQESKMRIPPLLAKEEYDSFAKLCLIEGAEELQSVTSFLCIQGVLYRFPAIPQVFNASYFSHSYISITASRHSGTLPYVAMGHRGVSPSKEFGVKERTSLRSESGQYVGRSQIRFAASELYPATIGSLGDRIQTRRNRRASQTADLSRGQLRQQDS